jgi:hypothetical protein
MLDVTGILFSTVMIAYVVLQAVRLDRVQAWFQVLKDSGTSKPAPRPWSRRP